MFCITQWPNCDLGVLRVKTDDLDNILCQRQKLNLIAGTLAQEVTIVSKNSNILIEIKALRLLFFLFEKKKTVEVIFNFFHLPCHIQHVMYVTLIEFIFWWLCNSFMKTLIQVLNSTAQLILELPKIIRDDPRNK